MNPLPGKLDAIAKEVVDSAFKVHSTLGPGLLESIYETCLAYELRKRGLGSERQRPYPVVYDGQKLEEGLRIDIVVENAVAIELKAAERMLPVFEAQVLTYLKLSGLRLGFLINFNVPRIKEGIKRFAL